MNLMIKLMDKRSMQHFKTFLYIFTLWSRRQQMSLMALIYSFIILTGYGLFFHHNQQLLTHQQHLLKNLSVKQTAQEAQIRKIPEYQQQLAHMQKSLTEDQILHLIKNLAQDTKVNLIDMTTRKTILDITLQSNYQQLLYFLDALNATPHFLLKDLKIQTVQTGVLQTQLNFYISLEPQHV